MSSPKRYRGAGGLLEGVAGALEEEYEEEGYEVQILELRAEVPCLVFQARERYREGWMKTASRIVGMDTAASVTLRDEGGDLVVEVGGGKWLDKAAVAGVATVMTLGLLLVPAGIGAWKQKKLLDDLERRIRSLVNGG